MDRRYMVKQFVACVRSRASGVRFRVFRTGDDAWYLFSATDRNDCDAGLQFPVRKADLRPELRRALRHGWGNTL